MLTHARQEAVVPLFQREILTDRGQVQGDDMVALRAQFVGRPHHERRFAYLAGGQYVTEFAVKQTLEKIFVGLTLNVGRSIGPQGATGYVEAGVGRTHSGS